MPSGGLPPQVQPQSDTNHEQRLSALLSAVASASPVAGLTHRFYRYPARFSPEFAARAIEAFTDPGDWVLDPFVGGGTTAVEALALGRRVVASDINSLSAFVTRAKTTPLTSDDVKQLDRWQDDLPAKTVLSVAPPDTVDWSHYQKNLPWWLRDTLTHALASVGALDKPRQRQFAKASLLRTAQWALDCRAAIPSREEFLDRHCDDMGEMLAGAESFRAQLERTFGSPSRAAIRNRRILTRSAAGLETDRRIPRTWGAPRLVLTSPPYVGVHILYHRWQVRGRRETSAAYWLAGCLDGQSNTYYNFADRRHKSMDRYLDSMRAAYASVAALMGPDSTMVQLVAFARPVDQLGPFMEALEQVGLFEVDHGNGISAVPVSRKVPHRKWYADAKGPSGASKEFLLIHRKRA